MPNSGLEAPNTYRYYSFVWAGLVSRDYIPHYEGLPETEENGRPNFIEGAHEMWSNVIVRHPEW